MYVSALHIYVQYLWSPEEDIGYPRTGVTDSCELYNVDTRNQTQVLHKSSKCLSPAYSLEG